MFLDEAQECALVRGPRESDGRIHGRTNWRLEGLQRAIAAGRVPTFEKLTATTSHEFYEEDPGTNYAQARYLCYYLQERGLLESYYHAFVAHHERDPTGYRTLQTCLGADNMEKFQAEWEAFVSRLRYARQSTRRRSDVSRNPRP